jgi:phosphatidylinositol-3-phosphatase
MRDLFLVISSTLLLSSLLGCGGGTAGKSAVLGPSTPSAPKKFNHVFVLVEENQKYSDVIGSPQAPYLNSLARTFALATRYYANAHNSLLDYFELTTGQTIAADDTYPGTVTANNVVRILTAAGKTWRVYAESLPSVGYLGSSVFPYARDHNPFTYFSDVLNDPTQASNVVGLDQLKADIANAQFADYSFIIPDQNNNTHDCPVGLNACTNEDKLAAMDQWLQSNIAPLLASSAFQAKSVLIITFDESRADDFAYGGGQVATIFAGSGVKPGYHSTAFYQHQSVLRFTLEALGLEDLPGAAAAAPRMQEFLK